MSRSHSLVDPGLSRLIGHSNVLLDTAYRYVEAERWTADLVARLATTGTRQWLAASKQRSYWTPSQLGEVVVAPAPVRQALLACASLAASGRVRERAVSQLGERGDPKALRFLMPRLVDWVPEVRAAAGSAAVSLLANADVETLLELGSAVLPWARQHSDPELGAFLVAWRGRVAAGASAPLRAWLQNPGVAGRAAVFGELLAHVDEAMLVTLLRDRDQRMRGLAAARLATAAWPLPPATLTLVLDGAGALAVARFLGSLARERLDELTPQLLQLCCVRQRRVRAQAIAGLARLGVDAAQHAREVLAGSAPGDLAGALHCLGETGTAADATLLAAHVDHGDARVRCAAFTAVARFGAERWLDTALAWLRRPSAQERRAAFDLLLRLPRWRWLDPVRSLVRDRTVPAATLVSARNLLGRGCLLVRWEVVPDVLEAMLAGHALGSNVDRLRRGLARLDLRGWIRPDAATRAALAEVLPACRAETAFAPFAARIEAMLRR
ncbi:MAG: hypothetical protein JNK15_14180 [Planctomycetes bacterium]|nr:hypothetical protein [Planctomycetota bacterium]